MEKFKESRREIVWNSAGMQLGADEPKADKDSLGENVDEAGEEDLKAEPKEDRSDDDVFKLKMMGPKLGRKSGREEKKPDDEAAVKAGKRRDPIAVPGEEPVAKKLSKKPATTSVIERLCNYESSDDES